MLTSGLQNSNAGQQRRKSSFKNLEDQIKNLKDKNTQGLSRAAQNIQMETAKKKAKVANDVQSEAGKIQYDNPQFEKPEPPTQEKISPSEDMYGKIAERIMPNIKGEDYQKGQWNPNFQEYFNRFSKEYANLQNNLGNSVNIGSENFLNELRQQAALNYQKYMDDLEKQRNDEYKNIQEKNKGASEKLKEFQEKGDYLGNIGSEGGLETAAKEINKILEGGSNLDALAALRSRFSDPRFAAIDQQLMSEDIADARGQAAMANRMLESAVGGQEEAANQYEEGLSKYAKEQEEGLQESENELNEVYNNLKKDAKMQDLESMKETLTGKTRSVLDKMIENDTVNAIKDTIDEPLNEMKADVSSMIDKMYGLSPMTKDFHWFSNRIGERISSTRQMLNDLNNSGLPNYVKSNLSNQIQNDLNNMEIQFDKLKSDKFK